MIELILASSSPRRAELLRQVGIPFTVFVPNVVEKKDLTVTPAALAEKLAIQKTEAAASCFNNRVILAADTIVVFEEQILGKPDGEEQATKMLSALSGNQHLVLTGLALLDQKSGRCLSAVAMTKVWMKKLSLQEIDCYIKSDEPFDKAGAYGIQGKAALFIERIEGCYFNVVGLPLSLLDDLIKAI